MKIGFAKGTTKGIGIKDLERQSVLLMAFNVDYILTDYRPIGSDNTFFIKKIDELENGTTIILESVCHISSNLHELLSVIDKLNEQGLKLIIIREQVNTCTYFGRAIIEIVKAAMELNLPDSIDATTPNGSAMLKMKNGLKHIEQLYKR